MKPTSYKVLLVDDDEALRSLLLTLLWEQGHQCIPASNGREALTKMKGSKFDAVITDIVMPGMDGIALTKELSKDCLSPPVMVMTGNPDRYSAETAIAAGAREFIRKPFSTSEFMLRFHKMMRDHEILCRIDVKNKEIVFNLQRNSMERIEELERETEYLKGRLSSLYNGPYPF